MSTKDADEPKSNDPFKESAQQIWLAGLGAFAKMQKEGGKAFESLVKDGATVQKKTQQAAQETLAQAQARMASFASEFEKRAQGGWGKLENLFEERVARALTQLGVPTAAEFEALQDRVDELEARLAELSPEDPTLEADDEPPPRRPRRRPRARPEADAPPRRPSPADD